MQRQSDEKPQFSVILPSYLEEENLRLLLPRVNAAMEALGMPFEVIVVDTVQPMDSTAQVCSENSVRYFNRLPSNSFGDAVRTGIAKANGQWIVFMDADGSHSPEFLIKLIAETPQNEIAIASRYIEGGQTENDWALRLMSRVLNFSYALVLNLKCKDVSNSFKIYRADLLKQLTLKCNNFDIIEEILYKICRRNKNLKIKEIPFSFKKRMFGETKRSLFVFVLTYFFTIIKLRFSR